MASKTKKSAASSSSTPQVSTSSSSVQSPITPTRMSRLNEKNQLANLNDRLAAYIEKNQQLEQENSAMSKRAMKSEEILNRSVSRVTTRFETELKEARHMVDETAKDKAKLSLDFEQIKKDYDETKAKFEKRNKEADALQVELSKTQNQLAGIQQAAVERDRLAKEKKELQNELNKIGKELEAQKQASLNAKKEEKMLIIDLENKLKAERDKHSMEKKMIQDEMVEVRTRRVEEIQEVDGRLQQEYTTKLQESIQELRQEYEGQLIANKQELDNIYDQKVGDLKAQLKRFQTMATSRSEENAMNAERIQSLSTTVKTLELEKGELSKKIQDLQKRIDDDHVRFAKLVSERDGEIEHLALEKDNLRSDYQDLMDTKVALDNEIATYRKLLETEERRLSLSPRKFAMMHGDTPGRGTPVRAVKRKRGQFDEEMSEAASEYASTSAFTGDITISEDDPEGKFVRLQNNADKEAAIGSMLLTRKAGDKESFHKFHRNQKIEPKGTVTIWSSDAEGAVHSFPKSIKMNEKKWFTGDEITTILQNTAGEEVARRETKRVNIGMSRRRMGFAPEDLFHQNPDTATGDRCTIV